MRSLCLIRLIRLNGPVFLDPLLEPLEDQSPAVDGRGWVFGMLGTEVEVMCAVFDEAGGQLITQSDCGAACAPGVEVPVRENYFGVHPELGVGHSSEVVKGVVVVWSDTIFLETLVGILLEVELSRQEHIVDSIRIKRHGLIPAGQNVPATHIVVAGGILENLEALAFSREVVIVIDSCLDRLEERFVGGIQGGVMIGLAA
jgi:hypothetical protein